MASSTPASTPPSGAAFASLPILPAIVAARPSSTLVPSSRKSPYGEPPTIRVRGLLKRFERSGFTVSIPALDIYPGELTYIGGGNGSGKSSLIRMLALEVRPDKGDLTLLDLHVNSLTGSQRSDLRGGGITYIPQDSLGLTNHRPMTAIQRVLHDYDGLSWFDAAQHAVEGLTRAQLPHDRFKTRTSMLSGGLKARVAVAKAFATRRPICLADEILAAVDQETQIALVTLFQELATDGYTVVIIAHEEELKSRFHRVITMSGGQVVSDVHNARPVGVAK